MAKIYGKTIYNVFKEFDGEEVWVRTEGLESGHEIIIVSSDEVEQDEIIRRLKKVLPDYQIDRWDAGTVIAGRTN